MSSLLRANISHAYDEATIFIADILAEPSKDLFYKTNKYIQAKCSRALAVADRDDIVVLPGKVNQPYLDWLHSLGLGPETVVAYGEEYSDRTLTQIIGENVKPLRKAIEDKGLDPVLVPFYCGAPEWELAEMVDAAVFGAKEDVALKFFNKESFKEECINLGLEVVGGVTEKVSGSGAPSPSELEQIMLTLLKKYDSLIIRGTEGSAGSSLYQLDGAPEVKEVIRTMQDNEDQILVEPFLKVISSPNDQWIISRDGNVQHLGLTAQLFKGLQHVGNLKGQYFAKRIVDYISACSLRIAEHMAECGYVGVTGIDYIVSAEGIFPIENNARMNGSTFTIGLVQNLESRQGEIDCWKFFKAKTDPCSFEDLKTRMGGLIYNGSDINSVFPYDCDTLHINGIFTPIILGEDLYHIEHIEQALREMGIERVG